MSETKKDFSFEATDEWDALSFDTEGATTILVDYMEFQDKPVYIEVKDVIDKELTDFIALELTKDQAVQLAYALLRIDWEIEKKQGAKSISNANIDWGNVTSTPVWNDERYVLRLDTSNKGDK